MLSLDLTTLAAIVAAQPHQLTTLSLQSVSTDSRQPMPGALFVALCGEHFDGHDFIPQAMAQGAAALLVSKIIPECPLPQLIVPDTQRALGLLGRWIRQQINPQVIAITGSCGKTTVKEMITCILQHHAGANAVLATLGNLNNELGVPLTLLRLTPEHRYAVLELGANHPGEISWTTSLAQPDVALINNVAAAHLEGFGSLAGVATAKTEIFEGVASTGHKIVNGDSEFWPNWQAQGITTHFSLQNPQATVYAKHISLDEAGKCHCTVVTPVGELTLHLPLPGRHNVANALAAIAATLALNIPLDTIAQGLHQVQPIKGRFNISQLGELTLIDDTYNASVESVLASINTLATLPGYRVLVFGDMKELGQASQAEHERIGRAAIAMGLDALLCVGADSAFTAQAGQGQHFADKTTLFAAIQALRQQHPKMALLVKGSRGAAMEEIVHLIKQGK